MSVALDWAQFAACALVIGYAGARLTRLAHAIGEKTGLSGSWIGLLLLGVVGASLLLERLALLPTIGPVGFYTPLLLLLYLVAMRSVYDYERRQPAPSAAPGRPKRATPPWGADAAGGLGAGPAGPQCRHATVHSVCAGLPGSSFCSPWSS